MSGQAAGQLDVRHYAHISGARAGFISRQLFLRGRAGIAAQDPRDLLGNGGRSGTAVDPGGLPAVRRVPVAGLAGNDPQCRPAVSPGLVRLRGFQAARSGHSRSAATQRALRAGAARVPVPDVFRQLRVDAVIRGIAGSSAAVDRSGPLRQHRAGRGVRHCPAMGRVAGSHTGEREDRPRFFSQRLRCQSHLGETGRIVSHCRQPRGAGAVASPPAQRRSPTGISGCLSGGQ